ncbi:pilus assembly protein PilM [Alkaliphilus serpentinus]|uniref:Cell division protein FtsA n=1 Tax=Alkaliphilus serpentinus TaxID=1482731 RepID=A0A833HS39_9FIRM|nr:pilus assembly protein PilM [Alkaliphilus serpentinus]KAB3533085.1 cell division protein FtsA [Alkaliphilus serpentinus]
MNKDNLHNSSLVFALDIGTRSVVGLLGKLEGKKLVVHHSAMEFHQKRAMFDGQIHDIEGVVEIVSKVKAQLEEKSGQKLKDVAIAAAGRALKTCRVEVVKELDEAKAIDKHLLDSIEIEGLQMAQMKLEEEAVELTNYYCAGHTIVNYHLNDGLMTNPIGHRGKKLRVDLIATFLPYIVVESLYTVIEKSGLNVHYMTLEPIAAIEVAVPNNVRLLNIAMVDIGAGTSDIAITKDGAVIAYGMTSTAGDEITEAIAKEYLLDFDNAEKLKCNLLKEEYQHFNDILGIERRVSTDEILDRVEGAISAIAKDIASTIIKQNGKAPSVVFLIGGGSQIPRLPGILADMLDIPKERVAVRTTEIIQNLEGGQLPVSGPEGITPVGILTKAIDSKAADFIEITVNKQKVKLFQTKELKVSDALAIISFNPRDLMPKRGKSLKVTINGIEKNLYGEYGEVAKVFLNNDITSLDAKIKNEDYITIIPAKAGKDAKATLRDLINLEPKIKVNDSRFNKLYDLKVNRKGAEGWQPLRDGDIITYREINTVADLCRFLDIDSNSKEICIKDQLVDANEPIMADAEIIIKEKPQEKPVEEEQKTAASTSNKDVMVILYNGNPLVIDKPHKDLIFVDIFNYIDFNRNKVMGKLVLKHNGGPADYMAPLRDGDSVEVRWE